MSEGDAGECRFNRRDSGTLRRFAYIAWIIAVLIPLVSVVLIYALFNPFPIELALASVVAGVIFFIPGYSLLRVANSYLVTSPEGVEYHLRGRVSSAKWSEVVGVGMVPLNERQPEPVSGEGLIIRSLKRPAIRARVQPDDGMYLWYIPLQPFGWHWKHTDLGREITRHAPHLMDKQTA